MDYRKKGPEHMIRKVPISNVKFKKMFSHERVLLIHKNNPRVRIPFLKFLKPIISSESLCLFDHKQCPYDSVTQLKMDEMVETEKIEAIMRQSKAASRCNWSRRRGLQHRLVGKGEERWSLGRKTHRGKHGRDALEHNQG